MRAIAARARVTALFSVLLLAACGGGGGGGGYGGGGGGGSPTITQTSFPIGGAVTGLSSSSAGLVLLDNGGDSLPIGGNGTFTFPTAVLNGSSYTVTIGTQPNLGPLQVCTVTNGSGTVASASVTTVTVDCATKVSKFLYVTNPTSNNVSGYAINASTGALTAIAGSPFSTEVNPRYVTAEPSGKYVYVSTLGNSTNPPQVSGFSLNGTSGVLTELANSPYPLSGTNPPGPSTLAINLPALHPSGLLGYLSIPIPTATLYGAALNASTGDLSEIPGFPISVGFDGQTPAIDSTGKYLFMANDASANTSGRISGYQISSPSGVLTPNGTPVSTGGAMPTGTLTPDGKFLIVVNQASSTLAVMAVDSAGTLSMVGSPVATGGAVGTRPSGIFMYSRRLNVIYLSLAAFGPSPPPPSIAAFSFNTTTGALTPLAGSPYSSNGATLFPWLHATGKFLYQVNGSNGTIQRYTIDQTTGVPTLAADVTTPADVPFVLVADPSGRYAYVTSTAGGNVSSYSIDQTTGALTLVNTLGAGTGAYLPQPVGLQ